MPVSPRHDRSFIGKASVHDQDANPVADTLHLDSGIGLCIQGCPKGALWIQGLPSGFSGNTFANIRLLKFRDFGPNGEVHPVSNIPARSRNHINPSAPDKTKRGFTSDVRILDLERWRGGCEDWNGRRNRLVLNPSTCDRNIAFVRRIQTAFSEDDESERQESIGKK